MKRFFSIIVFFLLLGSNVFSQSQRYLDSVSDRLLYNNNENYILIDAYNDGLIRQGDAYDIIYKDGVLKINGLELTGDMADKYIPRVNTYISRYGLPKYETFHVAGKHFDLRTAASYFGRWGNNLTYTVHDKNNDKVKGPLADAALDQYINYIFGKNQATVIKDSIIICSLFKDKLIDNKHGFNVRFSKDEILINNKKLEGEQKTKYLALSRDNTELIPESKNDFVTISYTIMDIMRYTRNMGSSTSVVNLNEEPVVVKVYPSPAKDLIHITIGDGDIWFSAKIIDPNGKVLRQTNENSMSVADLPSGIYFVMVSYQNTMQTSRVVVMH